MKAFMLVIACDGDGCVEALSLVDTESWSEQLGTAGWSTAVDGADLCRECTQAEERANHRLTRNGRHALRPVTVNR